MAGPGPVSHPAPTPRNDIRRGEGFALPTPATPWEASEVNVSPACLPGTAAQPPTPAFISAALMKVLRRRSAARVVCSMYRSAVSQKFICRLGAGEGPSGLGGFPGLGLLPVITCSHSTSILGGSSAQGQTLMQNRSRHLHVY